MRIALDGMQLASPLTGVGHYTLELAKAMALAAPCDTFTLVSPLPSQPIENQLPANLSQHTLQRRFLNRRWWSVGLPLYLKRESFDLFHGTNYEIPLWSKLPSVVTIHYLSLLLHPEAHERRLVRRARWRLPLMARRASKIITPTNSVKSEVCEKLAIIAERVVVTPEAPRSEFKRREDADVRAVRNRLGIKDDFLLFVGTLEPRKNLFRLLEAFERVSRETSLSPQLVIAGGEGWLMENLSSVIVQKGVQDRVRLTGYLKDDDLCALYSSCKTFIYPSLYEGFGLPPLEAMACGAPVITSGIPSITETVGDAARLVAPHDVNELSAAILELLSDEKVRRHFSEAGTERAKRFTWEKTARQTLEIYRGILE
jgi:glycosyltransferase involved in cell wall biosynthesis